VADKFDPEATSAKGSTRNVEAYKESPGFDDVYILSKAGDEAGAVAAWMYAISTFPGVSVVDRKLCVTKSQETLFNKLSEKKDLIQKQAEKVIALEEPGHSMAAVAARNGLLSVSDIISLADSKLTAAGIASGVTKMF
jgi:hypothetical protein